MLFETNIFEEFILFLLQNGNVGPFLIKELSHMESLCECDLKLQKRKIF